jgi:hypothetical protein
MNAIKRQFTRHPLAATRPRGRFRSLLLVLLCGSLPWAQAETSLWKVSHGDNVLYLGGTIHVLRQSDYPLPQAFDEAFAQAGLIGFETDLQQLNTADFQQALLEQARYPAGESLADHLDTASMQALQRYCDESGLQLDALLPYKPAFAMLTMLSLELARLDTAASGVDHYFLGKALAANKPTLGLETPQQQLSFLVNMGQGVESEFILHSLQDLNQLGALLQQMVTQWRSGNTEALNDLFIAPLAQQYPAIYASLLVERNNNWLPAIEALLDSRETELVLVGVAHLVGPDGLLRYLQQRGYKVEQL